MKPSCQLVAALLGVGFFVAQIIQKAATRAYLAVGEDCNFQQPCWNEQASEDGSKTVLNVGSALVMIISLMTCLIVMNVRAKIRAAHRIPSEPQCCGCDEDCCCAMWCQPCTICQMLRHVLDTSHTHPGSRRMKYNMCSENVVAV